MPLLTLAVCAQATLPSFPLIFQVPLYLWAFAHSVPSSWNVSLPLPFAKLILIHHWILFYVFYLF